MKTFLKAVLHLIIFKHYTIFSRFTEVYLGVIFWFLVSIFSLGIYSCNPAPKTTSEDVPVKKMPTTEDIAEGTTVYYRIGVVDYQKAGMKYSIFSTGNGDLFVVNITKDSLECLRDSLLINDKHFAK